MGDRPVGAARQPRGATQPTACAWSIGPRTFRRQVHPSMDDGAELSGSKLLKLLQARTRGWVTCDERVGLLQFRNRR
jgi:hypothetical protein